MKLLSIAILPFVLLLAGCSCDDDEKKPGSPKKILADALIRDVKTGLPLSY